VGVFPVQVEEVRLEVKAFRQPTNSSYQDRRDIGLYSSNTKLLLFEDGRKGNVLGSHLLKTSGGVQLHQFGLQSAHLLLQVLLLLLASSSTIAVSRHLNKPDQKARPFPYLALEMRRLVPLVAHGALPWWL